LCLEMRLLLALLAAGADASLVMRPCVPSRGGRVVVHPLMKAITIRPPARKRSSTTAVDAQTAAATDEEQYASAALRDAMSSRAANSAVTALGDAATTVTAASITALAATVRAASGTDGQNASAAEDIDLAVDSAISTASAVAGASVFLNIAAGFGKAAITTASAALVGPAFKLMGAAGAGLVFLDEAGSDNQTALSGQQIEGGLLYVYAASLVAAEALKSSQPAPPVADAPLPIGPSSPSPRQQAAAPTSPLPAASAPVVIAASVVVEPGTTASGAVQRGAPVVVGASASVQPGAPAVAAASDVMEPGASFGMQTLSGAQPVASSIAATSMVATKPLDRLRALLPRPTWARRMLMLAALSTIAVASGQRAGSTLLVRRATALLLLPLGSIKLSLAKVAGLLA